MSALIFMKNVNHSYINLIHTYICFHYSKNRMNFDNKYQRILRLFVLYGPHFPIIKWILSSSQFFFLISKFGTTSFQETKICYHTLERSLREGFIVGLDVGYMKCVLIRLWVRNSVWGSKSIVCALKKQKERLAFYICSE